MDIGESVYQAKEFGRRQCWRRKLGLTKIRVIMDARMRSEGFEIIESPLEAERISLAFSQATAPGRLRQGTPAHREERKRLGSS